MRIYQLQTTNYKLSRTPGHRHQIIAAPPRGRLAAARIELRHDFEPRPPAEPRHFARRKDVIITLANRASFPGDEQVVPVERKAAAKPLPNGPRDPTPAAGPLKH